jgi:hypothetical protein
MNPKEFKKQWTARNFVANVPSEVIPFPPRLLRKYPLSETDRSYLTTGIPKEAAPFLNFGPDRLAALEGIDPYSEIQKNHVCLGDDGAGNPITIDLKTRNIIMFDEDNDFRENYAGRGLETLLSFLLIFREFCDECDSNMEQARSNLNNYINRMAALDPSERWKDYWLLEGYQMILED